MILAFLLACADEPTPCEQICDELVMNCAYEAYPSVDTCLQACTYREESGVDVSKELTCLEQAACDPFATIECEHADDVGK